MGENEGELAGPESYAEVLLWIIIFSLTGSFLKYLFGDNDLIIGLFYANFAQNQI